MQWLQRLLPKLLLLGAVAVVLAALFSDHKTEYGQVPLPQGGLVTLPEGTTKVYLDEVRVSERNGDPRRLSGTLSFQVTPVGGGPPLEMGSVAGVDPKPEMTERSQGIGSKDAVAELEVPADGEYRASGSYDGGLASSLSFGTDPFTAVLAEWRIWGGLIAAAFLISLLPTRRRRRSGDASEAAEPGEAGAGYKAPGFSPYRG